MAVSQALDTGIPQPHTHTNVHTAHTLMYTLLTHTHTHTLIHTLMYTLLTHTHVHVNMRKKSGSFLVLWSFPC